MAAVYRGSIQLRIMAFVKFDELKQLLMLKPNHQSFFAYCNAIQLLLQHKILKVCYAANCDYWATECLK